MEILYSHLKGWLYFDMYVDLVETIVAVRGPQV